MENQQIRVEKIYNTRNPLIKTLELRATVEKPATANPIGFFLMGAVGRQYEERVCFLQVSTDFIDNHNIYAGLKDFSAASGHLCRIVVREGFVPLRKRKDAYGNLVDQEPKKVPGISFDYFLTKDGQPIYRNTALEINPEKWEDVYIQHDPIPNDVKERIKAEKTGEINRETYRISSPNIMSEPTLD